MEELETQQLEIETLLEVAYQISGYDFREYAQSALRRRIARHLKAEGLRTIAALQVKISHDRKALENFLEALTIDFTSMFRDAGFFRAFRRQVVPLLRDRPFIRIWHAGCASGEEAYSMAILLEEEELYAKTRIYATDMNPTALKKAQGGIFPIRRMKEFTANYQAGGGLRPFSDYYTAMYNYAILHPSLGKNITWAQHNLTCDGRFHLFDVIVCRNVMIYFNQDLKQRVHTLLYDSLEPSGVLGLGSHETVQFTRYDTQYAVLDENERIYIKARQVEQ